MSKLRKIIHTSLFATIETILLALRDKNLKCVRPECGARGKVEANQLGVHHLGSRNQIGK